MTDIHPLRAARIARDMTQEELSRLAGLSRSTVARIESGSALIYSTEAVRDVAAVMGVPWYELVSEFQAEAARHRDQAQVAA